MNSWGELPFIRILIAFAAGILLQLFTGIHCTEPEVTLAISVLLLLHFLARKKVIRFYRYASLIGGALQITLLMMGNMMAYRATDTHDASHYSHFIEQGNAMIIHINQPPEELAKTVKTMADVKAVVIGNDIKRTFGYAIIYLKKDSVASALKYGDELMVKNKFQLIPPPKNPDDFDYRKYAAGQNIYATAFLQPNDYRLLHINESNFIFRTSYWLREKSLYAIEKYIPSVREASVAEAMVIGDRDNLSFDTQQSFVNAGVIHIIVVAGLHVGILFLLLEKIFFFLDKRKQTRLIKSVLIVLIIWVFAFLTGLSGPVLRAATMFSFIALGKNLERSYNVFNVLAFSAFILLLFNPLFITQAGFQLSYLAVFGINAISPYINRWLYRTNKIVDYIWKIVAASSSAQLAVLPFMLHYFNQFPTYFLFANIVVIPLAFLIVWLGIFLIALQWIPLLAVVIGKIAQGLLYALNEFILRIDQLPLAVIHINEFDWTEVILLALALIFIIQFFISADKKFLVVSLLSVFFLFIAMDLNFSYQKTRKTFSVYCVPKTTCFEFSENGRAFFFQLNDSLDQRDQSYFQHHWQLQNLKTISEFYSMKEGGDSLLDDHLYQRDNLFKFYNYKVAIVSKPIEENSTRQKLKVDAVIISGNQKVTLKKICEWFNPQIIIFDSSNSFYKIKVWETEAAALGIAAYDVQQQGAFIKDL